LPEGLYSGLTLLRFVRGVQVSTRLCTVGRLDLLDIQVLFRLGD